MFDLPSDGEEQAHNLLFDGLDDNIEAYADAEQDVIQEVAATAVSAMFRCAVGPPISHESAARVLIPNNERFADYLVEIENLGMSGPKMNEEPRLPKPKELAWFQCYIWYMGDMRVCSIFSLLEWMANQPDCPLYTPIELRARLKLAEQNRQKDKIYNPYQSTALRIGAGALIDCPQLGGMIDAPLLGSATTCAEHLVIGQNVTQKPRMPPGQPYVACPEHLTANGQQRSVKLAGYLWYLSIALHKDGIDMSTPKALCEVLQPRLEVLEMALEGSIWQKHFIAKKNGYRANQPARPANPNPKGKGRGQGRGKGAYGKGAKGAKGARGAARGANAANANVNSGWESGAGRGRDGGYNTPARNTSAEAPTQRARSWHEDTQPRPQRQRREPAQRSIPEAFNDAWDQAGDEQDLGF
jgi:hypothetical protein